MFWLQRLEFSRTGGGSPAKVQQILLLLGGFKSIYIKIYFSRRKVYFSNYLNLNTEQYLASALYFAFFGGVTPIPALWTAFNRERIES